MTGSLTGTNYDIDPSSGTTIVSSAGSLAIGFSGNIWWGAQPGSNGNTQVNVSPTWAPYYLPIDPNGNGQSFVLVEWTQPGGFAAATPNAATLAAFASVEGLGGNDVAGTKKSKSIR